MDCLGNVAEMRDIVFQFDFLARMLLLHLVLALVIILEVGASLLLMNSDAHCHGGVFGVQQQEQPNYEEELVDNNKHWDDLEEEEEQMEEEELEAANQTG